MPAVVGNALQERLRQQEADSRRNFTYTKRWAWGQILEVMSTPPTKIPSLLKGQRWVHVRLLDGSGSFSYAFEYNDLAHYEFNNDALVGKIVRVEFLGPGNERGSVCLAANPQAELADLNKQTKNSDIGGML